MFIRPAPLSVADSVGLVALRTPPDHCAFENVTLPVPVNVPPIMPRLVRLRLTLLSSVPAVIFSVPPIVVDVPALKRYVPPPMSRKPELLIVPVEAPPPARARVVPLTVVIVPL